MDGRECTLQPIYHEEGSPCTHWKRECVTPIIVLENTKISLLPEEPWQIGNKISHYEQRKGYRNFLCVAFMLCEALCACVVIGLSYSNVADTVTAQAREKLAVGGHSLTFRHRASCILGQAFHYSSENAFYIFNQ